MLWQMKKLVENNAHGNEKRSFIPLGRTASLPDIFTAKCTTQCEIVYAKNLFSPAYFYFPQFDKYLI